MSNFSTLFNKIDELEPIGRQFLMDICNIESPTKYKAGVDAVGNRIAAEAQARGWRVERQAQPVSGDCICITMNPDAPGAPIALSGHMDTVHEVGLFGSPAVRVEGDKIHGPGVMDCKGGIAGAYLAMIALDELGYRDRPILLLLQSDEETSSAGSAKSTVQYMIEKARDCVAFLNCEGHWGNSVTILRKGIRKMRVDITGRSTHAANCHNGASAIREAAYKIIELEKQQDFESVAFNCGTITGGTVPNTVPGHCSFTVDMRGWTNAQLDEAEATLRRVAAHSYVDGTSAEVTVLGRRTPMEPSARNDALLAHMNRIYEAAGLPQLEAKRGAGGADAAEVTEAGIPCVDCVGVTGGAIHTPDEYTELHSTAACAKQLASVIAAWDEVQ